MKRTYKRRTLKELIEEFREVHGDEYIYDLVDFKKMKQNVDIICRIHGIFPQTPQKHLYGQGCPFCGNIKKNKDRIITLDEFLRRANKIHKEKYIYYDYNIKSEHDIIDIGCPKHGSFPQRIYDHLNGHGCPICGIQLSNAEIEICDFIKSLGFHDVVKNNRSIIHPYEIDIFIPSLNIGIEFNGLKWHSDEYKKDNLYHLNKLEMCNKKGVQLIQIFEDEYIHHKDAVYNNIKYVLSPTIANINDVSLSCKVINEEIASTFTEKCNTESFITSNIYIGCYDEEELVGVMSLTKVNKDTLITQFSTNSSINYNTIFIKLFNFFKENDISNKITLYADRRWLTIKQTMLYNELGFKKNEIIKPTFKYVNDNKRSNNPSTQSAHKIWDCGYIKFVYEK